MCGAGISSESVWNRKQSKCLWSREEPEKTDGHPLQGRLSNLELRCGFKLKFQFSSCNRSMVVLLKVNVFLNFLRGRQNFLAAKAKLCATLCPPALCLVRVCECRFQKACFIWHLNRAHRRRWFCVSQSHAAPQGCNSQVSPCHHLKFHFVTIGDDAEEKLVAAFDPRRARHLTAFTMTQEQPLQRQHQHSLRSSAAASTRAWLLKARCAAE